MNELINDVQWLACVLLFICAICDANDDLGAYTACRYSYDSTGNRTEKDCDGQKTRYAYNSLDQLTEEQTATGQKTTYRWDGRGNLLEKSTPSATIRYEWSSDNRLLKASDGSTSIRYGYDALGRRISRTQEAGGQKQETQWILDTARPYSEIVLERSRQNGGAWQETRYTHTPDGVGQLISEQRQGKTLHVYEDGQGSARLITDESSQIIETLDFDAFGNEEAGNPQESRHRYTGESYDSATGLYHLRARDYDPKTGRFISMDEHPGSQSIPLTLNKYLYGNADPVNHVDPSGNMSLGSVSVGVSAMGSMATMANIGRMTFYVARAISIACAMQAGITTAVGYSNISLAGQKGCAGNQMRLQIQASRAGVTPYTKGYVMMNIPATGVLTLQVRRQMEVIFTNQPEGFPGSLEDGLYSAIIRMSMNLHRYPPNGISLENYNTEREIIGEARGLLWRLDLENLRGTNLRR